MRLAGIKNHIGKDRHKLLKACGQRKELRVQRAHLRPKTHPCHDEVAFKAVLQVGVQPGILGFVQFKTLREHQRVRRSIPGGEECAHRAQTDLVRIHWQPFLAGSPTRGGFGVLHAVEDNHRGRFNLVQEFAETPA